MSEGLVWLITGAGRGMGVDIARAALDDWARTLGQKLSQFTPVRGCSPGSGRKVKRLVTGMYGHRRTPVRPVGKRVGFTPSRVRISYPPPLY